MDAIDFRPGRRAYEVAISVPRRARPSKLSAAIREFEEARDAALDLLARRTKLIAAARNAQDPICSTARAHLADLNGSGRLDAAPDAYERACRGLEHEIGRKLCIG